MQGIKEEQEHHESNEREGPESFDDSGRLPSQRLSLSQSVRQESTGIGRSSRHSFSMSTGIPITVDILESATNGPEASPSTAAAPSHPDVPLHRLAYLNKPEIPVLLIGTLAAAANGATLPISGLLISYMLKSFYEPADKLHKDSKFWAIIFVGLGLAAFLINPLSSYLFAVAGSKLMRRIRLLCFEKAIHMEVSWFDEADHSSGALGARLSTDAASLHALLGDPFSLMVQNTATVIAGMVIGFVANWQLAFIMLALIPLLGINGHAQIKSMKKFRAIAKVCVLLIVIELPTAKMNLCKISK